MKIRRFVAKDMRTALAQIKEELGAEAVIMSNKKIPEGVELMAAVDYSQSVPDAQPQRAIPQQEMNNDVSQNMANTHEISTRVASNREISNDVVNLSQQPIHSQQTQPQQVQSQQAQSAQIRAFGQNIAGTGTNVNNEVAAPADSLSALLNRQVQQEPAATQQMMNGNDAQIETTHYEKSNENQNNNEQSIEQQLRSFTDRLRQSTQDEQVMANPHNIANNAGHLSNSTTATEMSREEANMIQASSQSTTVDLSQSNVSQDDFTKMQQEMASIRQLLEHQVSGLMWQDMAQKDPQRAVLVNRLLTLGLNDQIADQIAGYVPAQVHEQEAWQQATQLIAQQLNTTQNDIIHRGGVVALVGPTGVGKTTTIAKLAARFAQMHGADQVALISTDTYRIAGFEQLETYGRIIGCQVKLAKDAQGLDALLQQFAKKKLILIDTAGMGQRDMRLAEHLTALISNARVRIRNYLVLAANSQQQVMQENVDRFKKVPLAGCIYTKLDESVSIGEIITTSIQNGLPIGYLTDGQRVPEDIKVANAEKLVTLADKMASKLTMNNAASLRSMPVAPAAVI